MTNDVSDRFSDWSRRLARGRCRLLGYGAEMQVARDDRPIGRVIVDDDLWSRALTFWRARTSGVGPTQEPVRSLTALTAAATTLAAAIIDATNQKDGLSTDLEVDPLALTNLAWTTLASDDTRWKTRGFLVGQDGVVSVAIADEGKHEILRTALRSSFDASFGGIISGSALELAHELQAWGLPCVPVTIPPASDEIRSVSGRALVPLPPRGPLIKRVEGRADVWPLDVPSLEERSIVVLGNLVAAPFAGVLLDSCGLRVTNVHHPTRIPMKWTSRVTNIPMDLSRTGDLEPFRTRVESSHGLINNLTARVLPNLGLTNVRTRGPHVSLPAMPSRSPQGNWKALGFQIEAWAGLWRLEPGPGAARADGAIVSDYALALLAAAAMCSTRAPDDIELAHKPTFSALLQGPSPANA